MTHETLKRAVLWDAQENGQVVCRLCRWGCRIANGQRGRCAVRENRNGVLYSLNYDKLCAANPDPIEKKPLFHFQPGSKTFSIAAPGCNFQCVFCQNWQISQVAAGISIEGSAYKPQQIVDAALKSNCRSVAYTYSEPTVFMELCADVAVLAKKQGLYNIFVSNGYLSRDAIDFVKPWLDAINVDLKSFSDEFYKTYCKARLQPVLDSLEYLAKNTDIWLEITTLLIPGLNDSADELQRLANFIAQRLSVDVPWHISRFFPQYQMTDRAPTPTDKLDLAYQIGKQAGLRYIYVGNLPGQRYESTYCYSCGRLLIERIGFSVKSNAIVNQACPSCGAAIAGIDL